MQHGRGKRREMNDMPLTTMNVSTRYPLPEEKLAQLIKGNRFPYEYDVHICAFFGEVPLSDVMRFCLKQGIGLAELKHYYDNHIRNRCPSKDVEEMLEYAEQGERMDGSAENRLQDR
jgi:hypothetical protein